MREALRARCHVYVVEARRTGTGVWVGHRGIEEHLRRVVGRLSGSESERRNSSLQERRAKDIDGLSQHVHSKKRQILV